MAASRRVVLMLLVMLLAWPLAIVSSTRLGAIRESAVAGAPVADVASSELAWSRADVKRDASGADAYLLLAAATDVAGPAGRA